MGKEFLISVLFFASILGVNAQSQYVSSTQGSELIILGTSTMHDWQMSCTNFSSSYVANYENNQLKNIESIVFTVPTNSLKSEEGKLMDNKCYNALKAEDYPNIKFTGSKMISFETHLTGFKGVVQGNLFLAGQTKTIQVSFSGNESRGYTVISGTKVITMSDYGIAPPTAGLGAMKTGDDITLNFKLKFSKKSK